MSNENIRKLPKKTVIIITALIILGTCFFFVVSITKKLKLTEALQELGYKHIRNIEVINKIKVEDKDSGRLGKAFKIRFTHSDLKQECIGFIIQDSYGKYTKNIDCK